jgi:hypothetical protein
MGCTWAVYVHEHLESGKKYIGITSQHPPSLRWGNKGNKYKHNTLFYNAIKKYGWGAFKHTILYTNLTEEEANQKEMELIALYRTQDKRFGYNIREGGQASHRSLETKAKIRASLKGRHYKTPTTRRGKGQAVECIETHTIYTSLGEAQRETHINRGSIYRVCSNPSKVAGGYHWRFINNITAREEEKR